MDHVQADMLKPLCALEGGTMRVAVLSPASELGGAERSLLTFLKSAPSFGIEATVVLPREGRLTEALSQLGVNWRVAAPPDSFLTLWRGAGANALGRMVRQSPRMAAYALYVKRLLDEISPHLIYTNGIKSHLLGAMLRPVVRKPVVWHLREMWGMRALGLMASLGVDHIIANSQATARALLEHMGRLRPQFLWNRGRRRMSVVYNAVDTDEFSPHGPSSVAGGHEVRIGLPAMMTKIKGHELLLRAASQVIGEFPSARVYFIGGAVYDTAGDKDYETRLRALAGAAPSEAMVRDDRVVFTGFQENMPSWYRAMDIVVNASTQPEGFGRTVLEGMACGRAVVAPDAGGIREFVRHGENGLLYRMGDADALAQALLALLRNEDLRMRLGQAGRNTAVTRFGVTPHVAAIAKILSSEC